MCSHKYKIQNISAGFFILLPGSCPRDGTLRYLGAKIKFSPAVCPLCYLPLNHLTKFNQIWCVSYSHDWGAQRQTFFSWVIIYVVYSCCCENMFLKIERQTIKKEKERYFWRKKLNIIEIKKSIIKYCNF